MNKKNIFVRHPYILNRKKTLDLSIFKNDIYSKKTENKIKFIRKTSFIIVNIDDSIHMKYLNKPKNFEKTYVDYISKTNQKEHTLETFKELKENFALEILKKNKILITKQEVNKEDIYIILDGCHRASIYYKFISDDLTDEYYQII